MTFINDITYLGGEGILYFVPGVMGEGIGLLITRVDDIGYKCVAEGQGGLKYLNSGGINLEKPNKCYLCFRIKKRHQNTGIFA